MDNSAVKTVVLIHGAWMIPASWDKFKSRFEESGYRVLTPTWPYMDRPPAELRANPDPAFGRLTVSKIVDHHEAIIRALPAPPLLVGHSFGGLIVQMLLDRGVGSAGVVLDSAPFAGVIPDFVTLRAALPVLTRFGGWNRPFILTRAAFDANFANTAPEALRAAEYERLVVPSPGRIFYQAAFGSGTGINPKTRKQPLLMISAEEDKTVAPPLMHTMFKKQGRSPSRTDFKSFPNLSHFLIAEPGWEKVADSALEWAREVATAGPKTRSARAAGDDK